MKKGPFPDQLFLLAGAEGIEPSSTVLETAVLPLNHAPSESNYKEGFPFFQGKNALLCARMDY